MADIVELHPREPVLFDGILFVVKAGSRICFRDPTKEEVPFQCFEVKEGALIQVGNVRFSTTFERG